jgi:hypothetical protein
VRAIAGIVDFDTPEAVLAYRNIELSFIDTSEAVDIDFDSYSRYYGVSYGPQLPPLPSHASFSAAGFHAARNAEASFTSNAVAASDQRPYFSASSWIDTMATLMNIK